jgi:predicted acetylornithine/succinylornithine family transaminase
MENIREMAERLLFQTYARFPIVIERGQGCRVWDSDGRQYLDLVAGLAVCNVGHCHPKVTKAIKEQAERLIHISNLYFSSPQVKLAEKLIEYSFADRVFFCNSGAEANEGALKIARRFAKEKGFPERYEVITMTNSFHGRTLATLAATGQEKHRRGFEPMPDGFRHCPFNDLNALEESISEKTCAIMVEPIQGEGGVNLPSEGYLEALRDLCDRKGILLIFDEVQTGMGRTGKLFAYQHSPVIPDIMTIAKGLAGGIPMGAILAKEEVASCMGPGSHASTFGGNPVCASAALAVISILIDDGLIDNCEKMGRYFINRLNWLKGIYPQIRDVRGKGLLIGMELDVAGSGIVRRCMEKGVLINCTVDRVLRFIPPLSISEEEIDLAIDVLNISLEEEFSSIARGGK